MIKNNQKGFTIVELVIVIAVIAILAAVMIPTFSGIVKKAEESNALSTARNAYTAILYSDLAENGDISVSGKVDAYIVVDGKYYFSIDEGELEALAAADIPAAGVLSESATTDEDWENKTSEIEDLATGVKVYLYTPAP